jgi:hypothetical protein
MNETVFYVAVGSAGLVITVVLVYVLLDSLRAR